jgi:hypothetical protein
MILHALCITVKRLNMRSMVRQQASWQLRHEGSMQLLQLPAQEAAAARNKQFTGVAKEHGARERRQGKAAGAGRGGDGGR